MDIQISSRAHAKILEIATRENIDLTASALRVAVVPGGCSGLTYDLGWDTTIRDTDETFEADGFRMVVDLKSSVYLEGTELDFSDGLEGKGFHFANPQAARTCACGESFSF